MITRPNYTNMLYTTITMLLDTVFTTFLAPIYPSARTNQHYTDLRKFINLWYQCCTMSYTNRLLLAKQRQLMDIVSNNPAFRLIYNELVYFDDPFAPKPSKQDTSKDDEPDPNENDDDDLEPIYPAQRPAHKSELDCAACSCLKCPHHPPYTVE